MKQFSQITTSNRSTWLMMTFVRVDSHVVPASQIVTVLGERPKYRDQMNTNYCITNIYSTWL